MDHPHRHLCVIDIRHKYVINENLKISRFPGSRDDPKSHHFYDVSRFVSRLDLHVKPYDAPNASVNSIFFEHFPSIQVNYEKEEPNN